MPPSDCEYFWDDVRASRPLEVLWSDTLTCLCHPWFFSVHGLAFDLLGYDTVFREHSLFSMPSKASFYLYSHNFTTFCCLSFRCRGFQFSTFTPISKYTFLRSGFSHKNGARRIMRLNHCDDPQMGQTQRGNIMFWLESSWGLNLQSHFLSCSICTICSAHHTHAGTQANLGGGDATLKHFWFKSPSPYRSICQPSIDKERYIEVLVHIPCEQEAGFTLN